jgi:O-antigen/teichoic acid export membrane protein
LKPFHFISVLVAEEVIPVKNNKLRIVWVIPNVFCYLMFIVFSAFVVTNREGLEEINRLSIWVIVMVVLLAVSIFGSYKIWAWIKEGKM